jgi:anti-sigma regulatory factor (Ser/Thr protein kinase)
MESTQVLEVRLPGDASAARRARAELRAVKDAIASVFDTVALLVTELVTNAVRHGKADMVDLALVAAPDRVRVEIAHAGPSFQPPAPPRRRFSDGGLGLLLVDRLADRWGVTENDHTAVWFEVGLEQT